MFGPQSTARRTVVVGMSGGVDSSVAAHRVLRTGAKVVGVSLRLLAEGANESHDAGIVSAARVASELGIEHHVIDATRTFDSNVLHYVADTYASGCTPNPCTRCNEEVKFALLAFDVGPHFFDFSKPLDHLLRAKGDAGHVDRDRSFDAPAAFFRHPATVFE